MTINNGGGDYMKQTILGEICVICEHNKEKGIHLYNRFICIDCEGEMIRTETSDDKYQFYLKQLRQLTKPEMYS